MKTWIIKAVGNFSGFVEVVLTVTTKGAAIHPATADRVLQTLYPDDTRFDGVVVLTLE